MQRRHTPELGRERVHDPLGILDLPTAFTNDVLQGASKPTGEIFVCFTVNATRGLAPRTGKN